MEGMIDFTETFSFAMKSEIKEDKTRQRGEKRRREKSSMQNSLAPVVADKCKVCAKCIVFHSFVVP